MFNKRQNEIITILSSSTQPVTGRALSSILNISLRTLQSEISSINRTYHFILSSNKGYLVNKKALSEIHTIIDIEDSHEYDFIQNLLHTKKPIRIEELADEIFVSVSTLEKRIKEYKEMLENFNLKIIRNHACLSISGKESDKRNLIKSMIINEIEPAFQDLTILNDYFPNTNIDKIQTIILNALMHHHYYIDDVYVKSLTINIIISLFRMELDNYIIEETTSAFIEEDMEYKIALEICTQYAQHFSIHPNKEDICYIASLLVGQIKPDLNNPSIQKKRIIHEQFIKEIDQILKNTFSYYYLNIDYADFLYNFALHIDGLILRSKNNQNNHNDYLYTLKKSFPFMYDVSVKIAKDVADTFHIVVCDAEISLITIHVGYLMENSLKQDHKVNILLSCDEYHQITDSIKTQLLKHYVDLITINQIQNNERIKDQKFINSYDLIITTKPILSLSSKVLHISPFYTLQDNKLIGDAINAALASKRKKQLHALFSKYFKPELFFMDDTLHCKHDVIEFLGNKLIEKGITDADFINSVKSREELSSTCFYEAFAIPHGISLNAKKTMCCVLINNKGIRWDDTIIHIVLMIAVQKKDRKDFMDIYEGVVKTLEDKNLLHHILEVKCFNEFIDILKSDF
ncbi:BglG family transcription antiterminator [Amedibacillus sp. YH-ame6]